MAQAARQLASISDEKLQDLRDRVDLVAIVQRRVPLKKSGRDWKGLCPFHGEKTPSFYVVPDKRIFHCFGCGATGDAIKFVMQLDGKSFREAIESLAMEAGVELAPADPLETKRAAHRAALAEVNEKACKFYERVLWEHPRGEVAREHLKARAISEETARTWRLGYAPSLWDALSKSLARSKVDPRLVEEAGLAVPRKKGQGLYDRFRGRLIIPIKESGRIVAFGGRLLEGESDAKYLNSPETPLYSKGAVLFGLDRARDAIRREGIALFVEGYFDAIGLHQGSIQTAVATCGTALTDKHLELVRKAGASEVVFIFDGDEAGMRAAQRGSEIAAAAGVPAKVFVPPGGEDPDETALRAGVEVAWSKGKEQGFREMLATAQSSIEFLLDRALARLAKGASIEQRVRAVDAVAGIVKAAPSELSQALYIEKVAEKIGTSADVIREALSGKSPAAQPVARTAPEPARRPKVEALPSLAARAEVVILAHLLRNPSVRPTVAISGAVSRFSMAELRELAEQALAPDVDIDALLATTESDWLRNRILSELRELESAGDTPEADQRLVEMLIASHEKTIAQEAAVRKQKRSPRVPPSRS